MAHNLVMFFNSYSFSDIDECAATPSLCTSYTNNVCSNTFGSYSCVCKSGYSGTGGASGTCSNVNECSSSSSNDCNLYSNTECSDTVGSYQCPCKTGYSPVSTIAQPSACRNIDECSTSSSSLCPSTKICVDTPGSYICQGE